MNLLMFAALMGYRNQNSGITYGRFSILECPIAALTPLGCCQIQLSYAESHCEGKQGSTSALLHPCPQGLLGSVNLPGRLSMA